MLIKKYALINQTLWYSLDNVDKQQNSMQAMIINGESTLYVNFCCCCAFYSLVFHTRVFKCSDTGMCDLFFTGEIGYDHIILVSVVQGTSGEPEWKNA